MVQIGKDSRKKAGLFACMAALVGGLLCKVSPIIGSSGASFTLSDILMPLSGSVSLWLGAIVAMIRCFSKVWFVTFPLKTLVYHTPGVLASMAWARPGLLTRVLLPLACMVLFIAHPIGQLAVPYTFYWFIPMILYVARQRSIFAQALSTTFVAHAVGSVIWLYFKQLPVAVWWGLLPIVACERLFNALLMTAVYYFVVYAKNCLQSWRAGVICATQK